MKISDQLNEVTRQRLLQRYQILDTPPERDYDEIAQLAATICDTPVALISFIDRDRIWYKARIGSNFTEVPRHSGVCDHVIACGEEIVVVTDIATDERFVGKAVGMRKAGMRFYAGAPLITPEGQAVGTVCVVDYKPRALSPDKARALAILARQVMTMLELRRHVNLLQTANASLAHHSMTDPLTGLPNRESFEKRLLIEGARAQRTKQNMALLLAEITDIAAYRDAHGNVPADNAIQVVTELLLANGRPYDYVARFDASKFAVILPGAEHPQALIVAARLKQGVANAEFPHAPLVLHTGFACVTPESDGPSLMIQAAASLLADQTSDESSQFAA